MAEGLLQGIFRDILEIYKSSSAQGVEATYYA